MSKKILISLSVIGVAAAIAIGGTVAYFSDTETSTGNTFTAGSIDLKIDNECYYNGEKCILYTGDGNYYWGGVPVDHPVTGAVVNQCFCAWIPEKDLVDGDLFFSFYDLKPGDHGEDTISLHVHDNDAYCWVKIDNILSEDNDCTEPEGKDENKPGAGQCDADGELDENIELMVWDDVCSGPYENLFTGEVYEVEEGDNIYQPGCDILLIPEGTGGPYTINYYIDDNDSTGWIPLYDGEQLIGCETYYIAKAWCFGEFDAVPYGQPNAGDIICDGSMVNNIPQTDSLSGDITFYCEQARNNPNPTPPTP